MLRAAIVFFLMGLFAYLLGSLKATGVSVEMGRFLLILFLLFSLMSFVASMAVDKKLR